MEDLKINDLKNLLENNSENSISIFIPTHNEWNNADQNIIRFKNHIRQIEKELANRNLKAKETESLLYPAKELLDEKSFWLHQSLGLAVFISQNGINYFRLPIELNDTYYISNRFCLKPVLPLFNTNGSFFILSLDLNECKLFKASRFNIKKINLPEGTPVKLSDSLQWDEMEKSLQFHTGTSGRLKKQEGNHKGYFHGHGSGGLDDRIRKEKILEFFHALSNGVFKIIGNENHTLILAGTEFLAPIYKEANKYPYIFDKSINTNPQSLKEEDLRLKAWELVKSEFQHKHDEAFDKYRRFSGNGLASSNFEEVVDAAFNKRIESLFIDKDESVWGKFNNDSNKVRIDESQTSDSEDLIDFSALHTILNKGLIYASNRSDMPCDKPMAAVFRY